MATLDEAFDLGNTFAILSEKIVGQSWDDAEDQLRRLEDTLHMKFGIDFKPSGEIRKLEAAIRDKSRQRAITAQSNLWVIIRKQLKAKP